MPTSLSTSNIGKYPLNLSSGQIATQANGSVKASFGDTVVLVTACMSKEGSPDRGFFPLMVEYREKTYAAGRIPGGFFKKEGRPSDTEILTCRLIDRPLRPLFPEGLTNEIQIVAMVLSSDRENDPDVAALNAASAALFISDIPFSKPIGAVRVSKKGDDFIVNPTYQEREESPLDIIIVGREENIVMLEGGFDQVDEKDVLAAIEFAKPFIKEIIKAQKELREKEGKDKKEVELFTTDKGLAAKVRDKVIKELQANYGIKEKEEKAKFSAKILESLKDEFITEDSEISESDLKKALSAVEEEVFRQKVLEEGIRPDKRGLSDIRELNSEARVLPRTHGTGLFKRGQTQALAITTLGTSGDEQFIEALEGKKSKHFMLHYNFPPFSVGEVKFMRGPSRRDIGHGSLAEKALLPVVPSRDEFPYTIRIVSEILESNGSSSMATVCASSLSMMDAGVPLKDSVAGIAIGMVTDGDNYKILTDIAGIEDHCGDLDFKVAGTSKGITAMQVDTKTDGITLAMIKDALDKAKEARLFILENMTKSLAEPREDLSKYAPKIKSIEVDPDKVGMVIGPGGKNIRKMSRDYNVTVDIDDDRNMVSVVAETNEDLKKAITAIENIVREFEVGDIVEGKVDKIVDYGAFCELSPSKSGLLHVSEIAEGFVKDVRKHLKEGDIVKVKVIGKDNFGKLKLSLKQAK
ncbi:MAG: polyribonucleotide nucleotidyltransferase [Candidatus Omnitrophica bacterium]|nr:polyribonucleotide nucleotidyltransferase [Candidatus Omnitrophota bacterium]